MEIRSEPKVEINITIDVTGSMSNGIEAIKSALQVLIEFFISNVLPVKFSLNQYHEGGPDGSVVEFDSYVDLNQAIQKVMGVSLKHGGGEENAKNAFAVLSQKVDNHLPCLCFFLSDYSYHSVNEISGCADNERRELTKLGFPSSDFIEIWEKGFSKKKLFLYTFNLLDKINETYCQFTEDSGGIYHKVKQGFTSQQLSQKMIDIVKRYFSILMQDTPHQIREIPGFEVVDCDRISPKLTRETDVLTTKPSVLSESQRPQYYDSKLARMASASKKIWTINKPDCIRFALQMIIFIEALKYLKTGDPSHLDIIKKLINHLDEMEGDQKIKMVTISLEQIKKLKVDLIEDEYFRSHDIPTLSFSADGVKQLSLEKIQKEFVEKICPLIKGLKIRIDPEKKGSHYAKTSYRYRNIKDLPNGLTCKTLKETLESIQNSDTNGTGSSQQDFEVIFLPLSGKESSFEAATYYIAKNSHIMDSLINIATRRDLTDTVSSTFRKAITTKLYQKINEDEKLIEEAEEEAKALVVDTIEDTFMEVIEEPVVKVTTKKIIKAGNGEGAQIKEGVESVVVEVEQEEEEESNNLIEDNITSEDLRKVDLEEGSEEDEEEVGNPSEKKKDGTASDAQNQKKKEEDSKLLKERMEKKIKSNQELVFTEFVKSVKNAKTFEEMEKIAILEIKAKIRKELKNISMVDIEILIEFLIEFDQIPKNSNAKGDKEGENSLEDLDEKSEAQLRDFEKKMMRKLDALSKLSADELKKRLGKSRKVSQLYGGLNKVWRNFRPFLARQAKKHSKRSKIAEQGYQKYSKRGKELSSFFPEVHEFIFNTMLETAARTYSEAGSASISKKRRKSPFFKRKVTSTTSGQEYSKRDPLTSSPAWGGWRSSGTEPSDWRYVFSQNIKELSQRPSTASFGTSLQSIVKTRYTTALNSTRQKIKSNRQKNKIRRMKSILRDELQTKVSNITSKTTNPREWFEFFTKENTAKVGDIKVTLRGFDLLVPELIETTPTDAIIELFKLVFNLEFKEFFKTEGEPGIEVSKIKIHIKMKLKASGWTDEHIQKVLEPEEKDPVIIAVDSIVEEKRVECKFLKFSSIFFLTPKFNQQK